MTGALPPDDERPPNPALPPRLSDGRLVPVGLCPVRVERERARRERWGALAAQPSHTISGRKPSKGGVS